MYEYRCCLQVFRTCCNQRPRLHHPQAETPPVHLLHIVQTINNLVSLPPSLCVVNQGRCTRENCKYLHPPAHLKTQLEINGRNNLIQQKTAAAMLAQQMQFMIPGTTMQPVVSSVVVIDWQELKCFAVFVLSCFYNLDLIRVSST